MIRKRLFFTVLVAFIAIGWVNAQQGVVTGKITETDATIMLRSVNITDANGNLLARSTGDGTFSFETPPGEMTLNFDLPGNEQMVIHILVAAGETSELGTIQMSKANSSRQDIPTISIIDSDAENSMETQTIQGLLSSSSDIFESTAAYTFGPARFRIRGYDSWYSKVIINGFVANDAETGMPSWSDWGGLNDVMRNVVMTTGPQPDGTTFEPVGGITRIITNASEYRAGIKGVYSLSNRTYRNRLMLTMSTGMLENNWAITGSVSRRWSDEGYVPGTFYDATSLFLAVEKKLNENQSLNFTVMDAMYRRGVGGGSVQEAYDLAGSNYYNPYWGYQNGGKRNSRVRHSSKPLLTLSHDWKLSPGTSIKSTVGYWFGIEGYTALNWNEAPDPRPDYYRYLPSYYTDPDDQARIAATWTDPSVSQVNWDHFYFTNRKNYFEVQDADGIPGNTVTGMRSKYIVEDRRSDISQFQFSSFLEHQAGKFNINAGLFGDLYTGKNFNVVEDLLGGDYWLDIDQFAERDFPDNPDAYQNDLNNPNRVVREGDVYSHNYSSHRNMLQGWGLARYSLTRLSFYLQGQVQQTSMWRDGHYRKGLFPDNSYGPSEILKYTTFGIKAGGELKITGRHIIQFNSLYMTQPPLYRNSFLSPRTRNSITPGLSTEKIASADISYIMRLPFITGRLTGYYTRFNDQTEISSFYHDELMTFVNYSMSGIDKEHYGIEFGAEIKITPTLSRNTGAAAGQYLWVSNPNIVITQDNNSEVLGNEEVWVKYFRVDGTPQTSLAAGLEYNSPNYWWAGITASYYDNIYIDFNPVSRTKDDEGYYSSWTVMEKEPPGFLLDAFIGKSWLINNVYINLSANISNITNNQEFITGGYEQYRFDPANPGKFPPKYYYYYGFNYFINLSIRM